jgi:hypothetical protein
VPGKRAGDLVAMSLRFNAPALCLDRTDAPESISYLSTVDSVIFLKNGMSDVLAERGSRVQDAEVDTLRLAVPEKADGGAAAGYRHHCHYYSSPSHCLSAICFLSIPLSSLCAH